MKRAVITGLGIVSSIGNNIKEVLDSLYKAKSGITFSEELKNSGMRSQIWGNIKLSKNDINNIISRKILRFMSDSSSYAYIAMLEAIKDSKLTSKQYQNNPRVGLIAGSGGGSPFNQTSCIDGMRKKGLRGVSPYMVTKIMTSGISACLSTSFKIQGINYSISSACATSAHCIGNAFEQIQLGKQDIIFAGGGEELCWELSCEFDAMGALSTKYNHIPKEASRTYDVNRDGFVIAGGSGIIILEELKHAISRNAHIYAEIIGYGVTSDGSKMVYPSGDGAIRCMRMALSNQHVESVDYLNAHGTSTQIGDLKELESINMVFGKKSPAISSTKSMTGHSLGAAGVQEIIYSILMLNNEFIAPSINIFNIDPIAKDFNIITKTKKKKLNVVMSNSFGFGGTNASLVMKKYK